VFSIHRLQPISDQLGAGASKWQCHPKGAPISNERSGTSQMEMGKATCSAGWCATAPVKMGRLNRLFMAMMTQNLEVSWVYRVQMIMVCEWACGKNSDCRVDSV